MIKNVLNRFFSRAELESTIIVITQGHRKEIEFKSGLLRVEFRNIDLNEFDKKLLKEIDPDQFFYAVSDAIMRMIPDDYQNLGLVLDQKTRNPEFWLKAYGTYEFIIEARDRVLWVQEGVRT